MSDLIELPTPHTDPKAQDRYRRERVALATDSALVDRQEGADTIKRALGIA
ncbi:hypothetical protein [Arthrobacter sp. GMC3]|uniref:hypothetical protein n=1 Tax=Arthrobacter sp. GMC3 TaxID=2058894 RepID=UPI0015E37595|nr:hypothetical protein [Arthrobacter sp. GMC3]